MEGDVIAELRAIMDSVGELIGWLVTLLTAIGALVAAFLGWSNGNEIRTLRGRLDTVETTLQTVLMILAGRGGVPGGLPPGPGQPPPAAGPTPRAPEQP